MKWPTFRHCCLLQGSKNLHNLVHYLQSYACRECMCAWVGRSKKIHGWRCVASPGVTVINLSEANLALPPPPGYLWASCATGANRPADQSTLLRRTLRRCYLKRSTNLRPVSPMVQGINCMKCSIWGLWCAPRKRPVMVITPPGVLIEADVLM